MKNQFQTVLDFPAQVNNLLMKHCSHLRLTRNSRREANFVGLRLTRNSRREANFVGLRLTRNSRREANFVGLRLTRNSRREANFVGLRLTRNSRREANFVGLRLTRNSRRLTRNLMNYKEILTEPRNNDSAALRRNIIRSPGNIPFLDVFTKIHYWGNSVFP